MSLFIFRNNNYYFNLVSAWFEMTIKFNLPNQLWSSCNLRKIQPCQPIIKQNQGVWKFKIYFSPSHLVFPSPVQLLHKLEVWRQCHKMVEGQHLKKGMNNN